MVPGPYSPTFVRTGSVSAGNSPAAGTAFGSHFLFPPPAARSNHHSLSPTSSQHALPAPPPSVTSSQPFSSYMSYSLSSHQLHAHAVQVRKLKAYLKARLHRAKAFAFFCIFQCRKYLHTSLVIELANSNVRSAAI